MRISDWSSDVCSSDLFAATHVHRLLQALLGLPTPRYHHHPLVTDAAGRRLAKRDRALTLEEMRRAGTDPAALLARLRSGDLTVGRLYEKASSPRRDRKSKRSKSSN